MASLQPATDGVPAGLGSGLDDEFVADEILARLPARCAVLSKRFRQLLATARFWLRHRRLGAPPEVPHVARLFRPKSSAAWEFHAASPSFAMKRTVADDAAEGYSYSYASNCNGLVLMSSLSESDRGQSSAEGVVFNPATGEEARVSLPLPDPAGRDLWRRILGFGYGPSSKAYKALVSEVDVDQGFTRLMVVPLDGSGGDGQQEPRTVFSSHRDILCTHSLHTGDGKVYFLTCTTYFAGEEEGREVEIWETTPVLAFDVDGESVASIALPEPNGKYVSDFTMLQIRGRPCIYRTEDEEDTAIWLLTPDHTWEQLYTLVKQSAPGRDDSLVGAWDCRGGLLLAVFAITGAYLYNLHEAAVEDDDDDNDRLAEVEDDNDDNDSLATTEDDDDDDNDNNRLAALSSLTANYEWPNRPWFGNPADLFDYRPTLISPASIFGDDAAFSGRPRDSVAPTHDLGGMFLEKTQKWIIDPAMQMLTNLEEAGLLDPTKIGVAHLKD